LLAFSRRQPLDPKPLDVNRFITNIVEFTSASQEEGPLEAAESGESILVVEDDYLLELYGRDAPRPRLSVIAAADATGALGFLDPPQSALT
jgi:hypothetical protein